MMLQWVMNPGPTTTKPTSTKGLKALESLGHKNVKLDEYESEFVLYPNRFQVTYLVERAGQIASEVIHPDDIDIRFSGTRTDV